MVVAMVSDQEARRGRGRPTRSEEQAIDRAIIDAAMAEFRTFGFHEAQMEQIARRAGVAKLALYRRYPGKVELLLALIESMAHALHETVSRLAGSHGNQPLSALRSVMAAFREHMGGEQHVALLRLVATTATADPRIGVALDSWRERLVAPVDGLIVELLERGFLRTAPVVTIRETLFDLLVNGAPSMPLQGMVEDEEMQQAFDFRWSIVTDALVRQYETPHLPESVALSN